MKLVSFAASLTLALGLAGAAHAEKWTYFPVPGGALAYETDGRDIDLTQGLTQVDVLTYYFVPRALGKDSYSVQIERLEFRCRNDQFRVLGINYYDGDGSILAEGRPLDWAALPGPSSPINVFHRVMCSDDTPPNALQTTDRDSLLVKLHALPPTPVHTTGPAPAAPASITLPATPPKP